MYQNILTQDDVNKMTTLDGHRPFYDEYARWTTWSRHETYDGGNGKNRFLPKINDYGVIPETGELFICVGYKQVTLIPEWREIEYKKLTISDDIHSVSDQNFRLYYDTSQSPYTLCPDTFLYSYAADATVARIYRGAIIDENNIISRVYNNSGDFIGHDIPLTLAAFNSHDNYSIKNIPTCNTNTDLKDGETCLIVIFNASGKVVNKTHCIVDNTTYIPIAYAEQRFITDIYLKSAFIDEVDNTTINFPVNLTIDSLNAIGVVVYNDGTEEEHIVDGGKFNLLGLSSIEDRNHNGPIVNSFAATSIGHKVPLVLTYTMDANEKTIMSTGYNPNIISKKYELIVSEPSRSYGVKLFAYPRWQNEVEGYTLDFYLLNLDRDLLYPVTSLVKLSSNSRPFYPTVYGTTQIMTYMIDLGGISTSFKKFNHVQTIEVILRGRGNDDALSNIWEVSNEYPTNIPFFGSDLKATLVQNSKGVNITNGETKLENWLTRLYDNTGPLINPTTDLKPVPPTHFMVSYGGEEVLKPIAEFNRDIVFKKTLKLYNNVTVVFYKQIVGNYLTLSVCEVPIRK